jgi:predicted DNA binding protein
MRAVIIGTDFIKDVDGSFKAIETNTNVGLAVSPSRYFNIGDFTQFVEDNNFTEIVVIFNNTNNQIFSQGELEPKTDIYKAESGLPYFIQNHYSGSSVNVNLENVSETSISIPFVEDSENKLIIRIAYDTTALIDDTYARDNWEFLKLMNDSNPNSIAKTYINDIELGFDSIGTNLRDNGNQPNYCVKKRITPANNNVYPKLLKISTIEELNILKNSLEADEYIQEYIFNESDLLNNKLKVYRSVDLVYGPELDSLNLWIAEQSNIMDIIEVPDYDDNNEIQIWDRNRYTTKYNSKTGDIGIKFSADEGTKILNTNNEIILVENLNVNDYVKSLNFPGLEIDGGISAMYNWTGSTDLILNEFSITASQVISKVMTPYFGEIIEIELENGSVFSDVSHASILTQMEISGSTISKFKNYEHLEPQINVFVWDNTTNSIITSSIVEIRYSYQELNAYTLNVEEFDLFLTLEESDGNRYGLITHNYDYDCINYTCGDYQMNDRCANCTDGYYIGNCNFQQGCCRIGGFNSIYNTNNLDPTGADCTLYVYYGYDPGSCVGSGTTPSSTGYCNGQKPSDTNIKKKIKFIAKTKDDLHIYQFTYNDYIKKLWMEEMNENLDGEWYGVIAQELIGTKYESALQKHKEGFYTVDYDKLPKWEIKSGYLIS